MMNARRKEEILQAYALHASIFNEVARRRQRAAALGFGGSGGEAVAVIAESPDDVVERVTARMQQVLDLMADGLTNQDIARQLRIGSETVKYYIKRLLATLGARNRAHAVTKGFRLGLLSAPAPAKAVVFAAQQPRAAASE